MNDIKFKCYWLVYGFFNDEKKTKAWFACKNPLFGGFSPNQMFKIGRGKKLFKIIEDQLKKNKPPDELINWDWPDAGINSNGALEHFCPHGVGHGGIHGCDGCCQHESFKRVTKGDKNGKKKKGKKKRSS